MLAARRDVEARGWEPLPGRLTGAVFTFNTLPEETMLRMHHEGAPGPASMADLPGLMKHLADLTEEGEPLRVVIERYGMRATLTVCPVPPEDDTPAPALPSLSKTERTILTALGNAGSAVLTAGEISARTGHADGGWFRDVLSRMRTKRLLTGENGSPGYGLTDLARSYLAK